MPHSLKLGLGALFVTLVALGCDLNSPISFEEKAPPDDFSDPTSVDILAESSDSIPWVNDSLSFEEEGTVFRLEREFFGQGSDTTVVVDIYKDGVFQYSLAEVVAGGPKRAQ